MAGALNAMMVLSLVIYITAAWADVTIYNVYGPNATPPMISQTAIIAAVGVDSGGSTTYVGTFIESLDAQPEGTTTATLISTPTIYTRTIIQDKSGFHYVISDADRVVTETCIFEGGGAICKYAGEMINAVTTSSYAGVTTGTLVPFVTIADPALQWATGAPNGAGVLHFGSVLAVICLSAVYLLL